MTDTATQSVLTGAVTDIKFSLDGGTLYAVDGRYIRAVDVATGTIIATYDLGAAISSFDVSSDGQTLAVTMRSTVDGKAVLTMVDTAAGTTQSHYFEVGIYGPSFHDVAFASDGTLIITHAKEAPVRSFDPTTGAFGTIFDGTNGTTTIVASHDRSVFYFIDQSYTHTSHIYSVTAGLETTRVGIPDPYAGASLPPRLVGIGAISPSGDLILGGNGAFVFNRDLEIIVRLDVTHSFVGGAKGAIFSPSGDILYIAVSDGQIAAFDTVTWEAIAIYDGGDTTFPTTSFGDVLQISADGSHLAILGQAGVVVVDLVLAVPVATAGDDVIDHGPVAIGLAGDDVFSGAGAQSMIGGLGDDTYYINDSSDFVYEASNQGYDRVITTVSAYVESHIEALVYSGSNDVSLETNQGNNLIRSGSGDDFISGGLGNDTMTGWGGNDRYLVEQVGDRVIEQAGGGTDTIETFLPDYVLGDHLENLTYLGFAASTLTGNAVGNVIRGGYGSDDIRGLSGDDQIFGGGNVDILDGGDGNDILSGGDGSDTASYVSALSGVRVSLLLNGRQQNTGSAGLDTLFQIENITGSAYTDHLYGNTLNNQLEGLAGADYISGGGGNDTVRGGDADDHLNGGTGLDVLHGGAGNDLLFGGADDDRLFGDAGDDRLYGQGGLDRLEGGIGNDTYFVDSVGDVVVESLNGGVDIVRATQASITLSDNVENLMITYGRFDGTGNALGNEIVGSDFINTLDGLGGNDKLRGKGGNDILRGGDGNDYLAGNAGQDSLTGGTGADRFAFLALNESTPGTFYADTIADFSRAEADKIILTAIDAIAGGTDDRFAFIGSAAFTGTAGQLRYSFDARGDTLVQMDVNGDGVADMSIRLNGQIDLVASDFLL